MQSHAEALAYLSQPPPKRGRPFTERPVATHTYVEHREHGAIAVRYHATDVVTYLPNGALQLRAGGWLTLTTMRRLEDFTPDTLRPFTRHRWMVATRHDSTGYTDWAFGAYPFAEGMTLTPVDGHWIATGIPSPEQVAEEDRWNAGVKRAIARGLRRWVAEGSLTHPTRCDECDLLASGHMQPNTTHLWQHVMQLSTDEPWLPQDLLRAVTAAAGHLGDGTWVTGDPHRIARFLRNRLYVGSVSGSPTGRMPATEPVRPLSWQSRGV